MGESSGSDTEATPENPQNLRPPWRAGQSGNPAGHSRDRRELAQIDASGDFDKWLTVYRDATPITPQSAASLAEWFYWGSRKISRLTIKPQAYAGQAHPVRIE